MSQSNNENNQNRQNSIDNSSSFSYNPPSSPAVGRFLLDFFAFRITIIEGLIPVIFALGLLGILYWGFKVIRYNTSMGLLAIIGLSLGLRLLLEFIMVGFSMLGILREIRNRLPQAPNGPGAN